MAKWTTWVMWCSSCLQRVSERASSRQACLLRTAESCHMLCPGAALVRLGPTLSDPLCRSLHALMSRGGCINGRRV